MRYQLLSGGYGKRRSFTWFLVILLLFSWCLVYIVIRNNAAEVLYYEEEIAALQRRLVDVEKWISYNDRHVEDEVAAIAEIGNHSEISNMTRNELKGVIKELKSLATPRYIHRLETSHLDCPRLFSGDQQYIEEVAEKRVALVPIKSLDMSCEGIRWRVLPRVRQTATNYGIAFARIVHTDYEFLEEQLRMNYSPENHYCYHVDSKSPAAFKKRIARLASCLPNVYVTNVSLSVDGPTGTNMNFAHLACLKLLESKAPWEYVVLQQTHDVVIRTNQELKRIFQTLNGSNDIQVTPCSEDHYDKKKRWDAAALGVFQGSSIRLSQEQLRTPLYIAKGAVQSSLSRKAVKWLNRIHLTKLIRQFTAGGRAVDEMLMSTLQIADEWEMPGRFTKECLKAGKSYSGITRMVHWRHKREECKSGYLRHTVCVLGVNDLPFISRYHHILVNKMMPKYDYGAIACVSELLFNRTYLSQDDYPLDMRYYENLPAVRFHNDRAKKDFVLHCENPYEYDWDHL